MTELEEIKEITGTEENVCACKECRQQCKTQVCLGTPSDILALVKAGFGDHIAVSKWAVGIHQGIPVIPMLASYYDIERECCTFLDESQKNCTLHDLNLKPTEGRLSSHSIDAVKGKIGGLLPLSHAVALTWTDQNNVSVVQEILAELQSRKS